jgi:acyl carrier protein
MTADLSTEHAVFARETIALALESGLETLLIAHWREVGHDRDLIKLDVDWDEYRRQELAGRYVAFSLRRGGELIGYNAFFVAAHLHYKAHKFALNDVVYLKPGERGLDGIGLILAAEKELRALGADKVFYHVKTDKMLGASGGDSLDAIEQVLELEERYGISIPDDVLRDDMTVGGVLQALGYSHVESNFGKLLLEG